MGTRSIIRVIEDGQVLMHMYQQFDGYLSGVGRELYDFLKDMHMANGFNSSTPTPFANGAGCLAAQLVAHFKTKPGGCYLFRTDSEGEEFNYDIIFTDDMLNFTVKVGYYSQVWEGTIAEFGAYLDNPPEIN